MSVGLDSSVFGQPILLSATGNVIATVNGVILGFYVASTAAGTLVLRQGGAGGAVISGTITPVVGWHNFPGSFVNGLHATIGGALGVTFFIG